MAVARWLILAALVWLPHQARALTLADLRTEARVLSLDNGSRLRFSTSTIDNWLNEAQRIAAVETRAIRKAGAFELVAGTTYYGLPSNFLHVARVTFKYRELGEETPESLAGKIGWNWIESKGQPSSYYLNFSTRTNIAFYPWPSATSDEPWSGIDELVAHHRLLAYFAAAHMTAIDGRQDLSAFYMGMFSAGLERMKREANDRPSYRPGLRPGGPTIRTGP